MNNTITIRVSDELKKTLETASKKNSVKASQIVREALERYLSVQRFRELRAETIPYAERAGFFTDEDVLNKPKKKNK